MLVVVDLWRIDEPPASLCGPILLPFAYQVILQRPRVSLAIHDGSTATATGFTFERFPARSFV